MAEDKVLTDKTGQELIKATRDLNKSIQDLSKVQTKAISTTATATDIMKKTGSQGSQQHENPILGVDGLSKTIKREDPTKIYLKNSLATLKDILKVNKEMLANSMKHLGRGLGSLLALGGLLGYLFTGKVELLYATAKGFIKGFIMPITKIIDHFVMGFAKNMLKEGSKIFSGFKNIFADVGKKFVSVFGGMASKLLKSIGIGKDVVKKGAKTITRYRNAAGRFVKKGTEGAIKEVVEVGSKTVAKEGLETLGKTAGVKGLSALLKVGGKGGLKGLAKIPILGTILGPVVGVMFAIQRWKKGDYVGALMEIGSGLASMIPFIGIPISLAIDIYMAFRDVKSSADDIKNQNKGLEKVVKGKEKSLPANLALKALARIPLFGAIIRPMLAMQKWKKGDKVGALLEVGAGLTGLVPGIGTLTSIAIDAYSAFRDTKIGKEEKLQEEQKAGAKIDQSAKKSSSWNMITGETNKQVPSYMPSVVAPTAQEKVTSTVPTVVQPSVVAPTDTTTPAITYDIMHKKWSMVDKGDADIDLLENTKSSEIPKTVDVDIKNYSVPTTPESYMVKRQDTPQEQTRVVKPVGELIKNPFIFRKGAKLKGALPKVIDSFTKMAQEYASDTKSPIAINSGYRSYDEQKALYLQYKAQGKEKYAANPDDPKTGLPKKNPTPHIAGKAVDVDSHVGDYLEQSGLLEKYGFYRPLMQRSGQPQNILEPWHIQAKPSLIGDAETTITNPEAISTQSYASNMDMMNSSNDKLHSAIRELIEVTKESNAKLQKTIGSQKITNKQVLSVNSLG